eukprot:TRINITY_DN8105_c0_g1_i1.p1 TRINITY_DN8105_c0_g1~~TRINITY_DN8105_c0_g1_i1.p1  ORF type:complete len:485 (+),score=197.98 TRINITY_DN8105_c0_g1_i1:248-1702(+)
MPAPDAQKQAVSIKVPAKDPKKPDDGGKPLDKKEEQPQDEKATKGKEKGKKEKKTGEPEELSEEDRLLKEGLELAVTRSSDTDPEIQKAAIAHLSREIRSATTSMTSVPKPLKFLRPHYAALVAAYDGCAPGDNRRALADVLSIMAMTTAAPGARDSLRYKLAGNVKELGQWGHEFLRTLAGQIGEEYSARITGEAPAGGEGEAKPEDEEPDVSDLMVLVDEIVPFHLQHNAEAEAVDLLVEVQRLPKLLELPFVDDKNYERVCLYLLRMADYMSDPDDLASMLEVAHRLYRLRGRYVEALRVALRLDRQDEIAELFAECEDGAVRKQMALLLGRHRSSYTHPEDDAINELVGNAALSDHFLALTRDLDVMEAKTPEDIYKSHLADSAGFSRRRDAGAPQVDSARANLASTFVNAFVNAGYGQDSLITPEGNSWLYKNKDHGMLSAAASIGMVLLWNVEEGLTQIDKFLYSGEDHIRFDIEVIH